MKSGVLAVHLSPLHTFSKSNRNSITLLQGLGVEGDAHCGKKVKHRSRLKIRPAPVNLRQVHLIHEELFVELKAKRFEIAPGQLGENITTVGLDLLQLPRGTKLHLGETAIVEITGLRNPCAQLNNFREGLLAAVLDKDDKGELIRKAGIMGIVLQGGDVKPGDNIRVSLPEGPFLKLAPV
jgi:MOSC domain-containing protein YiiM